VDAQRTSAFLASRLDPWRVVWNETGDESMSQTNPDPMRAASTSRLIDAPRERVFRAFSDPGLLAQWWGPAGFTSTFEEFDFRAGGEWRFVMHGPDGTNYPNASLFIHVNPPERIVFEHLSGHHFERRIRLSDEAGKTRVDWCQLFDTEAEFARVRDVVEPANEQNLDRLEALVATMS
jgi:uncharacterized protein YndB with AHSA1/START domain